MGSQVLALSLCNHGWLKESPLRMSWHCQGSHCGIGTDQWGSYWPTFNFCLFNHQKNDHTLLNGTNSPDEHRGKAEVAYLSATWRAQNGNKSIESNLLQPTGLLLLARYWEGSIWRWLLGARGRWENVGRGGLKKALMVCGWKRRKAGCSEWKSRGNWHTLGHHVILSQYFHF